MPVVVFVMLVSLLGWWPYPAGARGPGRPDLFQPAANMCLVQSPPVGFSIARWEPCPRALGVVSQTYTLPAGSRVILAPACDVQELLAASQEWLQFVHPVNANSVGYSAVISIAIIDTRTPAQKMRAEADQLERKGLAESRWRAAVSACTP